MNWNWSYNKINSSAPVKFLRETGVCRPGVLVVRDTTHLLVPWYLLFSSPKRNITPYSTLLVALLEVITVLGENKK